MVLAYFVGGVGNVCYICSTQSVASQNQFRAMGIIEYPIGQQDFKALREGNYIYVDKTRYLEYFVKPGKYFFLARPRRFGKSLFLSTLQYFFEGRRELFRGLYAETMDWDWDEYPVLHLDLNTDRFAGRESFSYLLNTLFEQDRKSTRLNSSHWS